MITLDQAKKLAQGQITYHATQRNADGTPARWKVTSVKTWVRQPERVEVRLRYGLYTHDFATQDDLHLICLTPDEALASKPTE